MSRRGDSRFNVHSDVYWVYYRMVGASCADYRDDEGYTFKLRLNLNAKDLHHQDKIITFLSGDGLSDDELRRLHLDVYDYFKVATKACRAVANGKFGNSGQFTLYFTIPCDYDRVEKLIQQLQTFLTDTLGVQPAVPLSSDFAVSGTENIGMRLERIDGEYIDSSRLYSCERFSKAYRGVMEDSAVYRRFALGLTSCRLGDAAGDAISLLFCRGFGLACLSKFDLSEKCQAIAKELRGLLIDGKPVALHSMLTVLEEHKELLSSEKMYSRLKEGIERAVAAAGVVSSDESSASSRHRLFSSVMVGEAKSDEERTEPKGKRGRLDDESTAASGSFNAGAGGGST